MGSGRSSSGRKWSPKRAYASPFLVTQRGPSQASSAGVNRGLRMALEDTSIDGSSTRIGQMTLQSSFSDANSSGSQDIQPEVLLRGGSYTRPDRLLSNDSAAPMQSVPEGRSLSKGLNKDDLPHARPPPRATPSSLSPLRPSRLPQGPDDPHGPLFVSSRSGSGSGFPIGQLQPAHHQVSPLHAFAMSSPDQCWHWHCTSSCSMQCSASADLLSFALHCMPFHKKLPAGGDVQTS